VYLLEQLAKKFGDLSDYVMARAYELLHGTDDSLVMVL